MFKIQWNLCPADLTYLVLKHSCLQKYGAVERSPVYVQFVNASRSGTRQAISGGLKVVKVKHCLHRAGFESNHQLLDGRNGMESCALTEF